MELYNPNNVGHMLKHQGRLLNLQFVPGTNVVTAQDMGTLNLVNMNSLSLQNLKTTVNEKYHKTVKDTYLDGTHFDNTRGQHNIAVNGLANSNLAGKAINIGSYGDNDSFINKDGTANISVKGGTTAAEGSTLNIGLQNLQPYLLL